MEVKDIISSGVLELYVLGAASEQESVQVESWMAQYPEIKQELEAIQDAMENYAMSHAKAPDPSVKDKLMQKLNFSSSAGDITQSEASTPQRSAEYTPPRAAVYTMSSYLKWTAAASFILLVGSMVLNYYFYNRFNEAENDLQLAQKELSEKQQVADAMKKDMDVVGDKNAMPVVLNGTEMAPDAIAKIYWMKNTGEVWIDPTNLPEAPSGKQYQLWAILDGIPLDGGMIATKKGSLRFQKMKTFGKAQAFAITLENMGGSPTPSKDMVVISKI